MEEMSEKPTPLEARTMAEVAEHACRLHAEGQDIVFTAAVIHEGHVIARAANEVGETGDVSRHAEVVAMARATAALERRDLEGCTLLASCQPCEMCLAAMRWAKIDRVIFAAQKDNIRREFFRFPGLDLSDFLAATDEGVTALGGICEDKVLHIYAPEGEG